MIDEDVYCIDVLTQISAVQSALRSVAVGLLDQHLHHCVQGAVREDPEGSGALVDEVIRAIERLLRA
jgi:DNA-binding FrmR family transcriptional regulator